MIPPVSDIISWIWWKGCITINVDSHSTRVVAGDFLRLGGRIIEKMHHFFWCLLGAFLLLIWDGVQCDYNCWFDCAWIVKKILLLVAHLWIHPYLVLGSCLWGVPVGALWTCNLVLSTGAASAVVWLVWGVGIRGISISIILALICPVVWKCIPISVLFCSIG